MWDWLMIGVWFCVLLLIMEESIYYFWNRYVYGPDYERRNKWKKRMMSIVSFFKKKKEEEMQEQNTEGSSAEG